MSCFQISKLGYPKPDNYKYLLGKVGKKRQKKPSLPSP